MVPSLRETYISRLEFVVVEESSFHISKASSKKPLSSRACACLSDSLKSFASAEPKKLFRNNNKIIGNNIKRIMGRNLTRWTEFF